MLKKSIPKSILDDNTEITDQKLILQQQTLFYENLYESRDVPISDELIKTFFDDENPCISKLGEADSSVLEGELIQKEVLSSLKLMKNGKSPGHDGFTIHFPGMI